jgi:glucose-1-phosphate adenylyltransferase
MSSAVFRFAEQASSQQVVAVILGGGRGTRLYPLTRERAKPAVPLGGRYRLVDIPLSNCINSGINRIFVLTQFNSRSMHRHINETYKFDIFSGGFVEILAAEQTVERGDWFQGTADAIRQNLWHLRNAEAQHHLILSGDHLYRMDYRDFFSRHLRCNADITVATLPVTKEAAKGFGIMKVEPDGRITEFVEKPQTEEELEHLKTPPNVLRDYGVEEEDSREYLASMGVYFFRSSVLRDLLESRTEWIDFGKHVIPQSLESHSVYSHLFSDFWEDIGTVQSYYDVSIRMVQPNPPFDFLKPGMPIYSRARYLPGVKVEQAEVNNSFLCEGSRIGKAKIDNSIVGIRSAIGSGASLEHCIMMGADYYERPEEADGLPLGIGDGAHVERAIIDKNARIGRNVVIRGHEGMKNVEEEQYSVVDGIVVVLKNAVIPDGTTIE